LTANPLAPQMRIVPTPAFAAIADAAALVVPDNGIAVVYGEHGVGKRTALTAYLQRQPLPVVRLAMPPDQSSRDIVRWLHAAVIVDDDLPERDLQDDLSSALAAEPRIVVIEHADRLSAKAAGQLQWLHARPDHRWPLFLLGGPSTVTAVNRDPLLTGQVCATVAVRPLKGDQLIRVLQDSHQMLLGAGPDLLALIDRVACHGVLQRWARFLQHALHLREKLIAAGRDAPVLTHDFARAVLRSLPDTILQTKDSS
jgi:hypothetical protein